MRNVEAQKRSKESLHQEMTLKRAQLGVRAAYSRGEEHASLPMDSKSSSLSLVVFFIWQ